MPAGITPAARMKAERAVSTERLGFLIAGAAPAFRVADEDSALDERQDVPQGGVLGALGGLRVLGRRELTLEAVEKGG